MSENIDYESLLLVNEWDALFYNARQLEADQVSTTAITNREGKVWGYRESMTDIRGVRLSRFTEATTGRRRIEVESMIIGDGYRIADKAGVITSAGNEKRYDHRDEGHTFTQGEDEWHDGGANSIIGRCHKKLDTYPISVTEEHDNKTIAHSNFKGDGWGCRISRITKGSGFGRVWAVYSNTEPQSIKLEFPHDQSANIQVKLGLGIVLEMGAEDKSRSPVGTTHHELVSMGLISN